MDETEELRRELAALRDELRRGRRRAVVAVALVGLGLLLAGARPSGGALRAERVEVTDDAGGRLVLQARRGNPEVLMTDAAGASLRLGIDRGRPQLTLVAPGGSVQTLEVEVEDESPSSEPAPVPAPAAAAPVPEPHDPRSSIEVRLPAGQPFSAIEVRCASGFRQRAPISDGVGVLPGVPPGETCRVHLLGGTPHTFKAASGQVVECRDIDGVLACSPR